MIVHCLYDQMVEIKDLKFHPKHRNKHPKEQIERLAKVLNYQGWRYAVKISKQTGTVTSGRGRVLAAKHNNWKSVPCVYQDYKDADQEYADVQSDNAIASWAELDLAKINEDMAELDPSFDLEVLALKNWTVDVSEKLPELNEVEPNFQNCIQVQLLDEQSTGELYAELKDRGFNVKVLSL